MKRCFWLWLLVEREVTLMNVPVLPKLNGKLNSQMSALWEEQQEKKVVGGGMGGCTEEIYRSQCWISACLLCLDNTCQSNQKLHAFYFEVKSFLAFSEVHGCTTYNFVLWFYVHIFGLFSIFFMIKFRQILDPKLCGRLWPVPTKKGTNVGSVQIRRLTPPKAEFVGHTTQLRVKLDYMLATKFPHLLNSTVKYSLCYHGDVPWAKAPREHTLVAFFATSRCFATLHE